MLTLDTQPAEDDEGIMRHDLPGDAATGLHLDTSGLRRLGAHPLGEGYRAVLVDGAREEKRVATHDRYPVRLEALGEALGVLVRRQLDPHLPLGIALLERLRRL